MTLERLRPDLARLGALAWPLVIARSTQILVGLSDTVLVSHLGESALAATTDGALLAYALLVVPLCLVGIVSAFAAQFHGASDPAAARRHAFYGLAMALVSQVIVFVLLPVLPWALAHFNQAADLQGPLAGYLRVRLFSAGAAVGLEALAGYYAGIGNTRLPMVAAVGALALNVIGNWLLIDGHWGLPALGVNGSALASTIATSCAFLGLLGVFLGSRVRLEKLSLRELRQFVRLGWPLGVNGFFDLFAFAIFVNVFIAGFGTTTLAAAMLVFQVSALVTLPSFAFASAGAVLVGQALGARASHGVRRLVGITLVAAACWQGVVGLAYWLLSRHLLTPFVSGGSDTAALIDTATLLLLPSAAWTLFDAVSATYSEALSAVGDTAITVQIRIAVAALMFVPGAWLLVHQLGAGWMAVILWYVASAALIAVLLHRRFRLGGWRHSCLTELATPRLDTPAET